MAALSPLFVLCTMRSFSSLACAMLGQHPQLYGLPEVNLAVADDLAGVYRFYARRPHGLHGLWRAIAQLQFGAQTEHTVEQAQQWLAARQRWSSQQLFEWLIARVAPRICVDKSPVTVRHPAFLERLYRMYPKAGYLHLTRHPRSCIDSIRRLQAELDRNQGAQKSQWIDAEGIWQRTNQHILHFKSRLAPGQYMHIQGEALLSHPDLYLAQIMEWLDLRTNAAAIRAMHHPENSPYACLGPDNACYGNDPNFLANPHYRWQPLPVVSLHDPLGRAAQLAPLTLKLARQLGYD
ncbi:MAG: sulfotransferase [Candidatus Competibacteraceae bacterium]|nr:sulfotransferase [Candidatus Competibacteraceae bacterium]HRY14914.1 sulfotransferase [Candidatus Competibacteraceae bacterium]